MYNIGIDLGGTNIVASVVDDKYNIIATGKTPTAVPRSAEEIFDDIAMACREALDKAGLSIKDISSVGLGTPGTVNETVLSNLQIILDLIMFPHVKCLLKDSAICYIYCQ